MSLKSNKIFGSSYDMEFGKKYILNNEKGERFIFNSNCSLISYANAFPYKTYYLDAGLRLSLRATQQ